MKDSWGTEITTTSIEMECSLIPFKSGKPFLQSSKRPVLLFLLTLISINIHQGQAFVLQRPILSQRCSVSPLSPETSGPVAPLKASATFDKPRSREDSFERRMRNLVQKDVQKPRSRNLKVPKNLKQVKTLQEYDKKVVGDERERLVVVRLYAPWCKLIQYIRNDIRNGMEWWRYHWCP